MELDRGQLEAISKLKRGSVLCGGVGTGKSRVSLAYYFQKYGGKLCINGSGDYSPMINPPPLYIITTAKKRDDLEWEAECGAFLIFPEKVDSWNNIQKYAKVEGAFFIFDEQRAVGYGPWSKTFIKISRNNDWLLLSATPGDKWIDYMAVFIANGFYKDKTDFVRRHAVYDGYVKYTKIVGYRDEAILRMHQAEILVDIPFEARTQRHHIDIDCAYDRGVYRTIMKDRWNPFDNEPIAEISKLCYLLRRVTNSDISRCEAVKTLFKGHDRAIVFYNFDYELDLLRQLAEETNLIFAEWNGHKHEPVPNSDRWAYFVNYSAGSEGWNCITTNVLIFFSQNYSYRTMEQACGRIDRRNTKFKDLYYYHLVSKSPIDRAIHRAISNKKEFNERRFTTKCQQRRYF